MKVVCPECKTVYISDFLPGFIECGCGVWLNENDQEPQNESTKHPQAECGDVV